MPKKLAEPKTETKKEGLKGEKKKTSGGVKKYECPISAAQFMEKATDLQIKVGPHTINAKPKQFKPGSFGWHTSDKQKIMVGEHELLCQIGINMSIVNSKNAPGSAKKEGSKEESKKEESEGEESDN
jgi:hypothetical protein